MGGTQQLWGTARPAGICLHKGAARTEEAHLGAPFARSDRRHSSLRMGCSSATGPPTVPSGSTHTEADGQVKVADAQVP